MMTRKDYVAVSAILSDYQEVIEADEYADMVNDFAVYMLKDNDRFDIFRFREACGIPTREYPAPKPAGEHVSLR